MERPQPRVLAALAVLAAAACQSNIPTSADRPAVPASKPAPANSALQTPRTELGDIDGCGGFVPPDDGWASEGGMTLQVDTNPNNALSAAAEVGIPRGVRAVCVHVVDPHGDDAASTPLFAPGDAGPMTVPVLLLQASTEYQMQAVGYGDDGGVVALSTSMPFTTQSLPPGVPQYAVATGGHPTEGGFTLIGQNSYTFDRGQNYASVVNAQGQPVWYLTFPYGQGLCGDLQKQPDGTYTAALYDPRFPYPWIVSVPAVFVQYDSLGNAIHTWISPDSIATNEHDLRLLPDGTALLLGIISRTVDMSQYFAGGMPNATVYMNQLERIAPDGGVLWRWNEFDHIPISSMRGASTTNPNIDASHTNSIDVMHDGNYLVSERNMSQIVKIDRDSGEVLWTLGGVRSNFRFVNDELDGPSYQHAARELPNGDIIIYDNGRYHTPWIGRGAEYALDVDAGTATLVWEYKPIPAMEAMVFGYSQRLDNGNTLVTFGSTGSVREVQPDGGLVWSLSDEQLAVLPDGGVGKTPRDWGIYRSFRIPTVY